MKQILLFLFLFSLTSCSFILKKWGGIKDPKIETYQSINKYSKTYAIDSSKIVYTKDSASYYKLNYLFGGSTEMLIFNKAKQFIPYKPDGLSCNAAIDFALETICKKNVNDFFTTKIIKYDTLLSHLDDYNNCIKNCNINEYDYIVFLCYAKYCDGTNKTHIIPWNKIIQEQKIDCKVKYIYVNLDYLNTWGIKKSSLPKFRVQLF